MSANTAEMPLGDAILELLTGAERMFQNVLGAVEPYHQPERLVHLLFFRRFTEWQYQYCRAIRTLFEAGCWQGTIPLLRSLFEASVTQIILQRDDFSTLWELLKGERIKMGVLKQIGWPDSQDDIYARLSRMTHPTRENAFLGRTLDFESEPLKTLVTDKELAGVASMLLWHAAREDHDAEHERGVFVALTTFDVAISSLFTLYGASAPEREWWNSQPIRTFEALAEQYPAMKGELLWFRLPWEHSKRSRVGRTLDVLFNSETD